MATFEDGKVEGAKNGFAFGACFGAACVACMWWASVAFGA